MEWTIEELDKLDKDIIKLYLHSEMRSESLADVMGKIDTKRYEINLANGLINDDETILPFENKEFDKQMKQGIEDEFDFLIGK